VYTDVGSDVRSVRIDFLNWRRYFQTDWRNVVGWGRKIQKRGMEERRAAAEKEAGRGKKAVRRAVNKAKPNWA
jgi:hypothetical protein